MAAVLPPELFSMIFRCLVDELPTIDPHRLYSTSEHIYHRDDSKPEFVDDPHHDKLDFWRKEVKLDSRGVLWHPLEYDQPIRVWSRLCRGFRQEAIPIIFENVFVITNRLDGMCNPVHGGYWRWSEDEEEQLRCSPNHCFEYTDHAWRQLQALRYVLPHHLHLVKTFVFLCRMGDGYHDRTCFDADDDGCDMNGDMWGEPTDHRGMLEKYLGDLTWILGNPKALCNATTLLLNTYQVGRPRVVEAMLQRPKHNRVFVYTCGADDAPDGIFIPYIQHFADVLCECYGSAGDGIPAEHCKNLRSITMSTALNLKFWPTVHREYGGGPIWRIGDGTAAIGSESVDGLQYVAMFDLKLIGESLLPIDLALNALRPALKRKKAAKKAAFAKESRQNLKGIKVVKDSTNSEDVELDAFVKLTPDDVRAIFDDNDALLPLRSQGKSEAAAIAAKFNEAETRTDEFWQTAGEGW